MTWHWQDATYSENPITLEDVLRFAKPGELKHIELLMKQLEELQNQLERAEVMTPSEQDVKALRRRCKKMDKQFKSEVQSLHDRIMQRRSADEWKQAQLRMTKEWEEARKADRQTARFEAFETRMAIEESLPQIRAEQVFHQNRDLLRTLCSTDDEFEYLWAVLVRGQDREKLAAVTERCRVVIEKHWGLGTHAGLLKPFSSLHGNATDLYDLYVAGIKQLLYYRTDEPRNWPEHFIELAGPETQGQVQCLVCGQALMKAEQPKHNHTEAQVDQWKASKATLKPDSHGRVSKGDSSSGDAATKAPSLAELSDKREINDHLGYADRGDAIWGVGQMYRDHGQFGSHPVYDGYGDEDEA